MNARPILRNKDARRLFLHLHALSGRAPSLQALFDDLAFVQLDSINTVARAHHMIIHARMQSYRPRDLDRLMVRERGVFEHWTHDASIIAMTNYPYWKLRFERAAERLQTRWANDRRAGFMDQVGPVLDRIDKTGPLCSSDVGEDEVKGSGGWWDWHPSKTALEYLWHSGQIAVCHRKGFRKYYDLAERIIPGDFLQQTPDKAATIDWACNAAMDRLGFATSGEIAAFFDMVTAAEARAWCTNSLGAGALIEIDVEGTDGSLRRSFARPGVFDAAKDAPHPTNAVRVLSPFDPALRDRKRAERLFGFHYRIEIFVPAPKRIYGYYVFPVLQGDRLVGRIDMTCEKGVLSVKRFWPEVGVKVGKNRLDGLAIAVERSARLAAAEDIQWGVDWLVAT